MNRENALKAIEEIILELPERPVKTSIVLERIYEIISYISDAEWRAAYIKAALDSK